MYLLQWWSEKEMFQSHRFMYSLKPQEKHIIPAYLIAKKNSSRKRCEIVHCTLYLSRHSCWHYVTFCLCGLKCFGWNPFQNQHPRNEPVNAQDCTGARDTVRAAFLISHVCCIVYENNLRSLVIDCTYCRMLFTSRFQPVSTLPRFRRLLT